MLLHTHDSLQLAVAEQVCAKLQGRTIRLASMSEHSPCAAGYLLCPQCGVFFGGVRGLRTHQQIKHAQEYGDAAEVVQSTARELVDYRPLRLTASAADLHADLGTALPRAGMPLRLALTAH